MNYEHDLACLQRAIGISSEAVKAGNHPFGGVIVIDGEVIAEAANTVYTSSDPTCHAEMNAIRFAHRDHPTVDLQKATIYCSTEPCAMCFGAIVWSRIGRVVYACSAEALSRIAGSGTFTVPSRELNEYCRPPREIVGPLLEDAATEIHRHYWSRAT